MNNKEIVQLTERISKEIPEINQAFLVSFGSKLTLNRGESDEKQIIIDITDIDSPNYLGELFCITETGKWKFGVYTCTRQGSYHEQPEYDNKESLSEFDSYTDALIGFFAHLMATDLKNILLSFQMDQDMKEAENLSQNSAGENGS